MHADRAMETPASLAANSAKKAPAENASCLPFRCFVRENAVPSVTSRAATVQRTISLWNCDLTCGRVGRLYRTSW